MEIFGELKKEVWKDIPGYEGYYSVSDQGRVKSLQRVVPHKLKGKKTIKGKILKTKPCKNGYHSVVLYKKSKGFNVRVHTLVMSAFVGTRPKGQEVMHLEPVKKNGDNSLKNLRYGSPICNSAFKVDDGTENIGSSHPLSKLKESDVFKIRELLLKNILTNKQIGEKFSVSRTTISGIANNYTWKHTGETPKKTPKVTPKNVVRIRELYSTKKFTLKTLGEKFGVSLSNISLIVNRKIWSEIV